MASGKGGTRLCSRATSLHDMDSCSKDIRYDTYAIMVRTAERRVKPQTLPRSLRVMPRLEFQMCPCPSKSGVGGVDPLSVPPALPAARFGGLGAVP